MLRTLSASLVATLALAGCGNPDLNALHAQAGMLLVNQDLSARAKLMGLETPGYVLAAIGGPEAGSYGGNAIYVGLVPNASGDPVELTDIEYDYTYTHQSGDDAVSATLVHKPTDAELRAAVERALANEQKAPLSRGLDSVQ